MSDEQTYTGNEFENMLLFQKEFRCLWIGQQIFVAVTWLDRAAISKRKHSSTCKVWVVGNQENVLCALIKSSVVKATDFHVSLIFVHLTFKVIIHDYPEELSINEIKEVYGSHCTNQLLWNSLVYLRPKSGPRPMPRGVITKWPGHSIGKAHFCGIYLP